MGRLPLFKIRYRHAIVPMRGATGGQIDADAGTGEAIDGEPLLVVVVGDHAVVERGDVNTRLLPLMEREVDVRVLAATSRDLVEEVEEVRRALAGRPADAEQVYRKDLEKNPENGWSLFGLAESLRAQGRTADADAVAARLAKAWAHADVTLTASRF